MSILTSLGIVIMAMLVQGFLQLSPSIFAIFHHYSNAKNSHKLTTQYGNYFILGAATAITFIIITIFMVTFNTTLLRYIMAGILVAFAIISFLFYFKKDQTTELLISRKIAKTLSLRAKNIKNRSDAFLLGVMSEAAEIIFILPAVISLSIAINSATDALLRASMMILYIIAALIPILVIRFMYKNDKNLADIQKSRIKNKNFYRLMLSISYLVLAFLLINTGILQ